MKRSILGRTVGQAFSTMLSDFPVPRCHAKTIDGKGYELGWLAGKFSIFLMLWDRNAFLTFNRATLELAC